MVGYLAMARRIANAGAFYAFISRGLGRPAGVGAALVAVVAYNLLQIGLYGMIGPQLASYAADNFGIDASWGVVGVRRLGGGGGAGAAAHRPDRQGPGGAVRPSNCW